ncbi:hypothetical protein Tco_1075471, partial [Tanacetum coccineum]
PKFLIKMPPRRNMNINDVYEQEFEWHIMERIEERLHQFFDQLADQIIDMMNPRRHDGVADDDDEGAPIFDDDLYEDVIKSTRKEIPLALAGRHGVRANGANHGVDDARFCLAVSLAPSFGTGKKNRCQFMTPILKMSLRRKKDLFRKEDLVGKKTTSKTS